MRFARCLRISSRARAGWQGLSGLPLLATTLTVNNGDILTGRGGKAGRLPVAFSGVGVQPV
jgi:hypothetical protein